MGCGQLILHLQMIIELHQSSEDHIDGINGVWLSHQRGIERLKIVHATNRDNKDLLIIRRLAIITALLSSRAATGREQQPEQYQADRKNKRPLSSFELHTFPPVSPLY